MARRTWVLAGCGLSWLVSVAAGARIVWDYQTTPGASATAPLRWPAASRVAPAPDRFTLVLIAHPHCPCTRASVTELARLMARLRGRVSAHVLVYRPREFPAGWEHTDVWSGAERIPDVAVHADVDGREAARFGAVTSGQVLLYDASGRRRFDGGITATRGHAGESTGEARIAALVEGRAEEEAGTRVFGCALGISPRGE
jgi:hypothetical protein